MDTSSREAFLPQSNLNDSQSEKLPRKKLDEWQKRCVVRRFLRVVVLLGTMCMKRSFLTFRTPDAISYHILILCCSNYNRTLTTLLWRVARRPKGGESPSLFPKGTSGPLFHKVISTINLEARESADNQPLNLKLNP